MDCHNLALLRTFYQWLVSHSMYMSVCKPAEKDGVFVVHGNRGSFHSRKQPAFRAIYSVFEQVFFHFHYSCMILTNFCRGQCFQYTFGSNLKKYLLERLEEQLQSTQDTNCGKMMNVFTATLKYHIST